VDPRHQAQALFRYSLIRELALPELSSRERGALINALAANDHAGPDGQRVSVSPVTLRRWLRAWRAGGFEALAPAVRHQPTRTPAEILAAAEVLKREAPKRTAAQVARALGESGTGTVSARTLQRHFARAGLNTGADGRPPRALGRFETTELGAMWTGDALHGPIVAARKTYLFAFIDDWSRTIPGWRWGLAETPCAWRRPCAGASRAGECRNGCSWTTGAPSSAASSTGRWPCSASASCTPPRATRRAGARSSASSGP